MTHQHADIYDLVSVDPVFAMSDCYNHPDNLKYWDPNTNTYCFGVVVDIDEKKGLLIILPFKAFNEYQTTPNSTYKMLSIRPKNVIYHDHMTNEQIDKLKDAMAFKTGNSLSNIGLYYQIEIRPGNLCDVKMFYKTEEKLNT